MPLDVHLMIDGRRPVGARLRRSRRLSVTFHAEAAADAGRGWPGGCVPSAPGQASRVKPGTADRAVPRTVA